MTKLIIGINGLANKPKKNLLKPWWVNFADWLGPVAIDVHLRVDYKVNKAGIRVVDELVCNNYVGLNNHHKSYGYLHTPGLSKKVLSFLKG